MDEESKAELEFTIMFIPETDAGEVPERLARASMVTFDEVARQLRVVDDGVDERFFVRVQKSVTGVGEEGITGSVFREVIVDENGGIDGNGLVEKDVLGHELERVEDKETTHVAKLGHSDLFTGENDGTILSTVFEPVTDGIGHSTVGK